MTATTASTSVPTTSAPRQGFRRLALRLDAVVSGANGVAYLALAAPLADLFGVSAGFLRPLGAFFVIWAGALWLFSNRSPIGREAMIAVALLNLVYVAGSLVFIAAGAQSPDTVGTVWGVLQAATVSGFAVLQLAASRR